MENESLRKPAQTKISRSVSIVIIFTILWFFIYTFLHEAGHALVGIAYGGTVESFVFWNFNAHVRVVNANFTDFGLALYISGGTLLPVAIGMIAICFYKRGSKPLAYRLCFSAAVLSLAATMVIWVVFPIIAMFDALSMGEDVWRFLYVTGYHPLFIALTSLLLTGAFTIFAFARGVELNPLIYFRAIGSENNRTDIDEMGRDANAKPAGTPYYLKKTHGRHNAPSFVAAGLLAMAVAVFVITMFVPYELPSLFNVSVSVDDVRVEQRLMHTFEADEERFHFFNVNVQGQGFVTVFRVYDSEGNWGFWWAGDEFSMSFGLELSKGTYTLMFVFLTDFETLRDYFMSIGAYDQIDSDMWQYYSSIFDSISHEYATHVSLRIR